MVEAKRAEDLACAHLKASGMRIVARNWRWRGGEVDIVALDGRTLVFVEVKARRGTRFGRPEEAVTQAKRRRLWRTAHAFVGRNDPEVPIRFDIVAVTGEEVRYIRDAFGEQDVR